MGVAYASARTGLTRRQGCRKGCGQGRHAGATETTVIRAEAEVYWQDCQREAW